MLKKWKQESEVEAGQGDHAPSSHLHIGWPGRPNAPFLRQVRGANYGRPTGYLGAGQEDLRLDRGGQPRRPTEFPIASQRRPYLSGGRSGRPYLPSAGIGFNWPGCRSGESSTRRGGWQRRGKLFTGGLAKKTFGLPGSQEGSMHT